MLSTIFKSVATAIGRANAALQRLRLASTERRMPQVEDFLAS